MISEAMLSNLICPETGKIMADPVVAADGYTYERDFIENWLKTNNTSPRTKAPLAHKDLYRNLLVKDLIKQHLKFFPELYSKPGVFVSNTALKKLLTVINNLDDVGLEKSLRDVEPHLLPAKLTVFPYKDKTVGDYLMEVAPFAAMQRAFNLGENPTIKEDPNINAEERIKKIMQLIADKVKESLIFLEKPTSHKEKVEISLEGLLCPISHELMLEPKIAPEGQTFDKPSIDGWLHNNNINPSTKNPLQSNQLVNNQLAFDIITTCLVEDQIPKDEVEVFFELNIDFLKYVLTKNSFDRAIWFIERLKYDFNKEIDQSKKQTLLHLLCSYSCDLTEKHKHWVQKKLKEAEEKLEKVKVVDVADSDGNSPLHLAAENTRLVWMELLLHAGANVKLKNNKGLMPLQIGSAEGFNLIVDNFKLGYLEILDEVKQQTVLHFVCLEKFPFNPNKELFAKRLADLKIDPLDIEGNSPLHLAIVNKKPLLVALLINVGADVNLSTATGQLPLQIALEGKNETIIESLLIAKFLDLTGKNGEAILSTAAAVKNEQVFFQLVLQGANPFTVNEKGAVITLLSELTQQQIIEVVDQFKKELRNAIENANIDFIRQCISSKPYLLDQSLDEKNNLALHLAVKNAQFNIFMLFYKINKHHITKYNKDGQTPLHLLAEEKWCREFIKVLIHLGQDINIVNANGDSILIVALLSQQIETVIYLLESTKIDINLANKKKQTALDLVIQIGNMALIETFILNGANVYYKRDNAGETLLAEQRKNNSKIFDVMDKTIEKISQNYIDKVLEDEKSEAQELERTYLYLLDQENGPVIKMVKKLFLAAINDKDVKKVQKLLLNFPLLINARFGLDRTALHFACDCIDIAKLLLQQGANVNAKSRNGDTPFYDALAMSNYDLVELFMKFSPDLALADSKGNYPIHLAATSKNPFVALLLLQAMGNISIDQVNSQKQTALHLSVINIDSLMVRTVLAYSPNVTLAMNQRGDTPLHYLAEKGNLEIFEKLCQYAEQSAVYKDVINRTNSDDNTPLHLAVAAGQLKIVKLLLEKNATISFNKDGQTPFHLATTLPQEGREAMLALFGEYKVRINAVNAEGDTSLLSALKKRDIKLIESFIRSGADLSIKDATGKNAFLLAVQNNLPIGIIKLTLQKATSTAQQKMIINISDISGFAALHFAVYSALKQDKGIDTEIIEFLLSKGADPFQKNSLNKSAIDIIEGNEQLTDYAENKKFIRQIFDEHRETLLKLLRVSLLANDFNVALNLMQQYSMLEKSLVNTKIKQDLEDLLTNNDIRPTLLEIATFCKSITMSSTQEANFFKTSLFSIILTWYKENSTEISKTIDSNYPERKSLARQLYSDIIKLSYAVCAVFPQDKIASEVILIHQKQFKQNYKSSIAIGKDEDKTSTAEFKFLQ